MANTINAIVALKDFYGQIAAPNFNKKWRKGSFLNPFCQLLMVSVRVDSPPSNASETTEKCRNKLKTDNAGLAALLGVSPKTLMNWERGRTKPIRHFWKRIAALRG